MIEEIQRFVAKADDGGEVTVVVLQESNPSAGFGLPVSYTHGMRQLRLLNGTPLNRIAKGVYENMDDRRVLSDSPDAS